MSALVACHACDRHVRAHEAACPFCSARREVTAPRAALARVSSPRLSRAALFLAGAAAASTTIAGCGPSNPVYGGPPVSVDGGAPMPDAAAPAAPVKRPTGGW